MIVCLGTMLYRALSVDVRIIVVMSDWFWNDQKRERKKILKKVSGVRIRELRKTEKSTSPQRRVWFLKRSRPSVLVENIEIAGEIHKKKEIRTSRTLVSHVSLAPHHQREKSSFFYWGSQNPAPQLPSCVCSIT